MKEPIKSDEELDAVFFFLVERMMKKSYEKTSKVFKEYGFPVTKDQWVILKLLAEDDGSTQTNIANKTLKDPAALTRILDLLVKKKLVSRKVSESDRRTYHVFLTVDGRRLVNKMVPVVQNMRADAFKGLSQTELRNMKTLISKIYDNLK